MNQTSGLESILFLFRSNIWIKRNEKVKAMKDENIKVCKKEEVSILPDFCFDSTFHLFQLIPSF